MINLVFLLDITGSMGNELEGVKRTVSALVKAVFEEEYEVMITIITFTEDMKGCYVTKHSFTDGTEATRFISSVKLCVPPGSTGINANGGDGDENHKAALAELLTLDNTMATIAFLITDAGPHLVADSRTSEATEETIYLSQKHQIHNTDIFHILSLVQTYFEDRLILNVIKYVVNSDHRLYGSIAKQFNGVFITPKDRSAQRLAAGLMAILTKMFARCMEAAAPQRQQQSSETLNEADANLNAFDFYDLSTCSIVSSEAEVRQSKIPQVGSTKDVLFDFLERATVVVGDKFAKRAITATGLQEQVELLLVIAKCLTKMIPYNVALDRATTLVTKIRAELPEENQGHFKIRVKDLPSLLSQEVKATNELEAVVSAITLMSTEEMAKESLKSDGSETDADASVEFDPQTVIQTVAGLFLSHLAVLQLPEKNGKVDFMDSWAAVITKISTDVMTAADFLTMIADDTSAPGLSIRSREYNYAQIMADPADSMGNTLLQIASGTQVLDILTALLAGAPAGQFCPNMFCGTMAASLMQLVSQHETPLQSYQWQLVRKLVHSIRLVMRLRPTSMEIEPESAISKLVFRLLRLDDQDKDYDLDASMRLVLQELLATHIQRALKYNEAAVLTMIEDMVGYHHDGLVEDVFQTHALDKDEWKFDSQQAVERAAKSTLFTSFECIANNLICAVYGDGAKEDPKTLETLWPKCKQALPKYLLLQKRTARYCIKTDASKGKDPSPIEWQRNGVVSQELNSEFFASLAMQILRKKYDAFLRDLRARRADAVGEQRWQAAIEMLKLPYNEFTDLLSTRLRDSSSLGYKLLLKAFKMYGDQLKTSDYEAKVQVLITGRLAQIGKEDTIVFNRGNLHPNPDLFVPMSDAFKTRLRTLRKERGWSLEHKYRPGSNANRHGHCSDNPSSWAKKRSLLAQTFWES